MIPVISLNDKNIVDKMYNAYSTIGFAVFTDVYDNWILEFKDWFQLAEEFFALPSETKLKYSYSGVAENIGYGWVGQESLTPNMPGALKETFNWSNPPYMSEEYWPVEIADFRALAENIHRISRLVSYKFLANFEKALKLSAGTLVEKHLDNVDILRINHYPADLRATEENQIRGGSHTDYDTITLLYIINDVGGLQVFDRVADQWIDAPIIENSVIVNIADMFQRWTNDTFLSTPHRVVNNDMTRARYTMPHFVTPRRDVVVTNLMNDKSKYDPISAYDYLQWRLSKSYVDDEYKEKTQTKQKGLSHLPENAEWVQ